MPSCLSQWKGSLCLISISQIMMTFEFAAQKQGFIILSKWRMVGWYHLIMFVVGGRYCSKCWPFMGMAMEVISTSLQGLTRNFDRLSLSIYLLSHLPIYLILCVDDFGFDHFQWFYSGRRGVRDKVDSLFFLD